jgi:hypothetical protein
MKSAALPKYVRQGPFSVAPGDRKHRKTRLSLIRKWRGSKLWNTGWEIYLFPGIESHLEISQVNNSGMRLARLFAPRFVLPSGPRLGTFQKLLPPLSHFAMPAPVVHFGCVERAEKLGVYFTLELPN